jgi:predicted site-specific integrase-resolvase
MKPSEKSPLPEPLLTIKEAAPLLNIKYWQLQRAVKRGLVPSYTLLNSKKHVRLSEVAAAFKRWGGAE